jgi:starch synthase
MKILFVSSEVAPFVKVGGLADVVGALPKELNRAGHDARIVCPLYGSVRLDDRFRPLDDTLVVQTGDHHRYARVWEGRLADGKTPIYFLEHHHYFDRHEVYTGPWGSHGDNGERFTFLSRASLDLCAMLGWTPDVVHAHDWPTGLVPVMVNTLPQDHPVAGAATVFTIHNIEHQGCVDGSLMKMAGLPDWVWRADGVESCGMMNMMKGGIYHANKITTVSPSYAKEIQNPVGGCGLHETLQFRSADLIGIVNGIDEGVWNPATDPLIPAHYTADDMAGKAVCKRELQRAFLLEEDPTIPVFGVISRLATQKGLDLLAAAADWILNTMRVQLVVLGAGETDLQWAFGEMPHRHPGRMGSYIGFHNGLAHLIEAGSDFFVMPSRFEPCGLNQLYSMRYGTPPIVRATGGFLDTVDPFREGQNEGTGFLFDEPSIHALYYAVGWACATYYDRPNELLALRQRGMRKDFSWTLSMDQYLNVYTWALQSRGRSPA